MPEEYSPKEVAWKVPSKDEIDVAFKHTMATEGHLQAIEPTEDGKTEDIDTEAKAQERAMIDKYAGDDLAYKYRLLKSSKYATPEEIRETGVLAYQKAVDEGNPSSALLIAEDIYGKESPEFTKALSDFKDQEEAKRQEYRDLMNGAEDETEEIVTLSKKATIAEMEANHEYDDLLDEVLDEELGRGFDPDVLSAYIELSQKEKESTTVLDFFAKYGYSQDDVELVLPVRFEG
jgi:hypothetical protein